MSRLDGQVALVTGASRGFGRATAILLARAGADVIVNYRAAASEAESVAHEVRGLGRRALVVQADVSDPRQAHALAQQALDTFDHVEVLVNNAGIMDVRPFVDQDLDTWHATLETNLFGLLVVTRALLPSMIAQQRGRVICLSSQLAHVGAENFAVYAGTKAFILAFTKSLAREVGRYSITVNAVCPGSIVTDMNRAIYPPERITQRAAELPLRRLGDPTDVAEAVLFLAADSGRFITGQCLDVNGGATMA